MEKEKDRRSDCASLLGQRINLEIEQYLRTTAVPAVVLRYLSREEEEEAEGHG